MSASPVDSLMQNTMESLKDMIDVNTVIGEAVETKDGGCIIPISKVSFGFASGGSEYPCSAASNKVDSKYPFGGGSGAGVSVKPVAFLVVKNDMVRLLPVNQDTTIDKIVDTVPQVIDIIKDTFSKKCSSKGKHNKDQKENTNGFESTSSFSRLDPNNISNFDKDSTETKNE
ncbi:GerW family sporulation protein [uncultured Clostridium sp.]|uniref:GerW family sporulation protein n=1 Tax=uncultured Clostridium sp. TaxID=59620 RepID=UPI0025CED2B8|nr:GerW family sporulation protein [uncultured Clostridium sp.]